ncbi:SET domain-containing protein 5 [Lasiodiplodia hormozganensis]|uniref:SET domain-containing protein 5 n=1 Tax=Lasiodiplodia hormozganensis TaxID=869390 RepID=A0AA39W3M6_9PEZI|nr:SET domain-containing protein 5 [Lasiodiplodia hormozganensis]
MGIDAGFDMDHYKDDVQVEVKPNYIEFKAGEHPLLPFEGHKFLRFSSKISGSIASTTGVESYINTVTRIAKVHFGSRVQPWNECFDQYGEYDWDEVNESMRSYEEPDEPEIHTSLASFLNGTDPIKELDIPLFEVKDIPRKGRGLIARFDISKGTRILCEKPLLTVESMPPVELEQVLATKLKALCKASQRQFLSLHNNFPGRHPFSGIVKTNALPCGSGSPIGGIYPTICLINHSCVPNSHNNWNSNVEHETIHAIRPIKAGEEITIPYDQGGTSAVRRAFLKESFGFECNCRGCSRPTSELQASDTRRLLIQSLDEAIGDPSCMMCRPKESLNNCHLLLQALEEEYDGCASVLGARLYYDAFQVSITHGDQARASVFAERAYKFRVIGEGEDSPETQKMKSFALKPANHGSFGLCSMNWKTTRGTVPKGLDTVQFEKWLFRE